MNTLKSTVIIREGVGQMLHIPVLMRSLYGLIARHSRSFSYENCNVNFNFGCVLAMCIGKTFTRSLHDFMF